MIEYAAASAPVLSQHLRQQRAAHPGLTEDLAELSSEIGLAVLDEPSRRPRSPWWPSRPGGRASTGTERILDLVASEYHQRVPLLIGGADEVGRAEALYRSKS